MSVDVHSPRPAAIPLTRTPTPRWPHTLLAVTRRALRDRRRAVLTWGAPLGALSAFMAAIYPSIQKSIEQVVKNYPAGLKEAFGAQAMNTVEGYVHAEMFSLILPLAIGYFAIRAVSAPVVGAEERGQLDTTLSLPISRTVLIIGSYLAAALVSLAVMVVIGAMTFVGGSIAGTHISAGLVAAGAFGVWALALFCGGLAALAGGAIHSPRAVTGISLGVIVAMYAIDVAGRLASSLSGIRWASAFRYYGAPLRDGLDPVAVVGLVAVGAALAALGALLLERRDLWH